MKNEPLVIRFSPYAIVIGKADDIFNFMDTAYWISGISEWKAERMWSIFYKVKQIT